LVFIGSTLLMNSVESDERVPRQRRREKNEATSYCYVW
jgi:hypothetical protein